MPVHPAAVRGRATAPVSAHSATNTASAVSIM
jgi:hypothetical protein